MDRPESQKLPKHRIVVLVLLIFGVLACYFTVMFNLQIVHGAEYRSQMCIRDRTGIPAQLVRKRFPKR